MKKKILGASIGNCVHVAGIIHFLDLADKEGYETVFLGPAVSVDVLFERINEMRPDEIAVSYRLTPNNARMLIEEINNKRAKLKYNPKWLFGGTKPNADIAKEYGFFSFISDGFDEISDSIRYLRGQTQEDSAKSYGTNIVERIEKNHPFPVLRHHFGLPDLEKTVEGVKEISQSKVLDVISLGPDQNAQQFFFSPGRMKAEFDGAGGVPIRREEDLRKLKEASRRGNYPLMRCYSGTEDVFKYAPMLKDTIDNAWAAVPLYWYNELDGRGTRKVEVSIKEAQKLIKWHAERNIPVEINEPHHWGLRDAHDVMPVVAAYISAYNAKKLGVKNYIAQYMFNNPNGLSLSMDLAKVLAMIEVVESLEDDVFKTYRQTRVGLPFLSVDENVAKGQLAASTFMQMLVKPHIIHVVAYCEADHAATPEEIIESCKIVKGVIRHTVNDSLEIDRGDRIAERKNELIKEAKVLIEYVKEHFSKYEDPLLSSEVLAECVKRGYFDAPHIVKNDKFRGTLCTKLVGGKCIAYDKKTGEELKEIDRLKRQEKVLRAEDN